MTTRDIQPDTKRIVSMNGLKRRKKTRIHLACSGKGGVGKSLLKLLLAHWAGQLGYSWSGLDLDSENKVFHAIYAELVAAVTLQRADGTPDPASIDLLSEKLEALIGHVDDLFIDIGAGQLRSLITILTRQHFAEAFADLFEIVAYPIVIQDPPALLTLRDNVALLEPLQPIWIIVRNCRDGVPTLFDQTNLRSKLLQDRAMEITLPAASNEALAAFRKSGRPLAEFIMRDSGEKWQHRGEICTLRDRVREEFLRAGIFEAIGEIP